MIRIEFNVGPILDRLAHARETLSDLTPVHRDITDYMQNETRERFRSGVGPDGSRWREKSPTTLAEYLHRHRVSRPDPLIGPSKRLGREIIGTATADASEIGSNQVYSGVMQFGARRGAFGTNKAGRPLPWGDIPARPFIGLSDNNERTIITIVDDHITKAVDD